MFVIASSYTSAFDIIKSLQRRKKFGTAAEAEIAARRMCRVHGETAIYQVSDGDKPKVTEIAECLVDNLGRCWTQVNAKPGEPALL